MLQTVRRSDMYAAADRGALRSRPDDAESRLALGSPSNGWLDRRKSGTQKNITLAGSTSRRLRPTEEGPAGPSCGTASMSPSGGLAVGATDLFGGTEHRHGRVSSLLEIPTGGLGFACPDFRAWCSGSVLRCRSRAPVTRELFGVVGRPVCAARRFAGVRQKADVGSPGLRGTVRVCFQNPSGD